MTHGARISRRLPCSRKRIDPSKYALILWKFYTIVVHDSLASKKKESALYKMLHQVKIVFSCFQLFLSGVLILVFSRKGNRHGLLVRRTGKGDEKKETKRAREKEGTRWPAFEFQRRRLCTHVVGAAEVRQSNYAKWRAGV